jgi:hypothetical protein
VSVCIVLREGKGGTRERESGMIGRDGRGSEILQMQIDDASLAFVTCNCK